MKHRFPHERDLVHQPKVRGGHVNSAGQRVQRGSVVEVIRGWSHASERGVVSQVRQRRGDTAVDAEVVFDKRAGRRRNYADRLASEYPYVREAWEKRIEEGEHDCSVDWININSLSVVGQAAQVPVCETPSGDGSFHGQRQWGRWLRPALARRSNRKRWTEEQVAIHRRLKRTKSAKDRETLIARSVKLDHLLSLVDAGRVGRPTKRQKAIIKRRLLPKWGAVPNFDAMTNEELGAFYGRYSRASRQDAENLVGRRPGFTGLARDLARLALNIQVAREHPELTYGKIAEQMYARLPEDLQWREP